MRKRVTMTIDTTNRPFFEAVKKYVKSPNIRFHMPGHAGKGLGSSKDISFQEKNLFKADLTEIDALDDLQNPTGILLEAQNKVAEIYDAEATFFLVNGSTIGMQALIMAATAQNKRVLVARNCHKSVISGIILAGAQPTFFQPTWIKPWGLYAPVNPQAIAEILGTDPSLKTVVITSPAYDGTVSDIRDIADICNHFNATLIVDESHGGHFNFCSRFPQNAIKQGADAVVHSLHKTCGALTQTAILNVSKDSKIDLSLLGECVKMLQTTSPSSTLLMNIDQVTSFLTSDKGIEEVNTWYERSNRIKHQLCQIDRAEIYNIRGDISYDNTKIFLKIKGLDGFTLADILLRDHRIEVEAAFDVAVLLFININNSEKDLKKLKKALEAISENSENKEVDYPSAPHNPILKLSPRDAFFKPSERISIKEAVGRIARYPVAQCPPGICTVLPGEEITLTHIRLLGEQSLIDVILE